MTEAFVPVHPARPARIAPVWQSLFNEHARNAIAGWSTAAFTEWYTRRNVLGITVHIPRRPEAIERVLLTNAANYEKPRLMKRVVAPLLGRGLVSSDGALWRSQRKLVAPAFAPGAVARLTSAIADAADARIADWPESGTVDVAAAATSTTMRVIAGALFSGDSRLMSAEATRQIERALTAAGAIRVTALLGMPGLRIGHVAREGERGQRFLRDTLTSIVRERGAAGGEDFLGEVIRGLRSQFAPEEATMLAVDNAATFYVAGHETTANALAWSLYLLANAPEVQDRARAEAVSALAGDTSTLPDRLPYLRQVLDEALRLYPPAPRFEREAMDADALDGHRVRKGDIVSVWPWLLHRHAMLWDRPDAFDPDRFAPGSEAGRHRFQYIPFGGGPRICVGARFATAEALVILAHWLAARRFAPEPGFVPDPVGSVTLRPRGGLLLRVTLA
ncbi:MAG: cytochrome P450 [Pseudomonadota bacterium]